MDSWAVSTHEIEPLLLQSIHDDLKELVRDRVRLLLFALSVELVKPLLV
jgi:hypothetical protein